MKSAKFYRNTAWDCLCGSWKPILLQTFVFNVIYMVASGIDTTISACGIVSILLVIPVSYSYNVSLLEKMRGVKEVDTNDLFNGFNDYKRMIGTYLLMYLYIYFWTLLLIIPGIIKAYSYSMVPYILHDEPSLSYNEAIERSMAMMKGHKSELFWLHLTFIGWSFLCVLTLGLAFIWVSPYLSLSVARFYDDVKAEYEATVEGDKKEECA